MPDTAAGQDFFPLRHAQDRRSSDLSSLSAQQ